VEKIVEPLLARYADKQKEPPSPLLIRPFYLIAEKILQKGESLPEDWPIYGTTGYEFMNALNGIFVESANEKLFDDIYTRFTRARIHFPDLVYEKKKLITRVSMSSEINVLGHQLDRLSEKNRWSRDFTLNSLTDAIREIIACFPVYRTYIDASGVKEHDRVYIEMAVARAKRKNPAISASIFDFVRDILLLKYLENSGEEDRAEQLNFVMKFQQCTGPVIAKGLEDTAFYIYNRLVSLNEVGGDPQRFGLSVSAFHRQNLERCERWPYSLSAISTHDTKRSEDVRSRINVLSEVPQEWRACLTRWSRFNKRKKVVLDGQPCPDRNEEYLLYQTLLGAWPMGPMGQAEYERFKERIRAYMLKAIKEAKVHTSWMNPNRAYDGAVLNFVSAILEDSPDNLFLEDFRALQRKVAHYGMYNSLSQTLLKVASPGVPDIYQGNEIWDFSLVDPDNRRRVDYETRSRMLKTLQTQMAAAGQHLAALARELVQTKEDGRIKLYVTYRALSYRRERKDLFAEGSYIPLEGVGNKKEHICAFARKRGNQTVIVVVPRLLTRLTLNSEEPPLGKEVWEGSCLVLLEEEVSRGYRNIFTGETVETTPWERKAGLPLEAVFASFPVALLEGGTMA
jgi:(1->4)-alpha-D-glucan 1-alpha-D-glucosylmutase